MRHITTAPAVIPASSDGPPPATHPPAGPRKALFEALSPKLWLLVGVVIHAAVGLRFNVSALAWVALVPWLVYLRSARGWRAMGLFHLAVQVAFVIQLSKIISAPIPWIFAPLFSVPMALATSVSLWGFERLRRRVGDGLGLWLLPAMWVVLEWLGWRYSAFGSWGALAYTQIENTAFLQQVALVGLAGPAFVIALVNSWLALVVSHGNRRRWLPTGGVVMALLLIVMTYGSVRIFSAQSGPTMRVGGVVSDLQLTPGHLPDAAALIANDNALFERSHLAARRGAQLVVWNEGATLVSQADEPALLARGQAFAQQTGTDLVLAYIVPKTPDGSRFENKFVWLTPTGPLETYHKRHPVPGEGATAGLVPGAVHTRPYGQVAGAICYDYDFPTLGLQHASGGAGVVVVPSSDWRGIDPYHTQMARVRGIEGGFSVVRPVRAATSGAYDAYGRTRATLSWFEDNDRVFVAQVPARHVPTLYAQTGDLLPWLCLLFLLVTAGRATWQNYAPMWTRQQSAVAAV
ncbi:MAG: hypothetical protein KC502_06860 [Myxococcales bacterium]|nr:hypothetical protein [Myxococcales bacterium]